MGTPMQSLERPRGGLGCSLWSYRVTKSQEVSCLESQASIPESTMYVIFNGRRKAWEQRMVLVPVVLSIALVAFLGQTLPSPGTGEAMIIRYATAHDAHVWFADEQAPD